MKFIRYTVALSVLTGGGLFAATTAKPAKDAKYKKIEAKKQTHAKRATPKSTTKDRYGKAHGSYTKMEMKKHEKGLSKPTTKPAKVSSKAAGYKAETPATAAAAKKAEPSAMGKAAEWLGLGAAGAAATKAVATHGEVGHHTGPRKEKWVDNFGPGAENKGFVEGVNEHGHWVFAGYRPDWWEKKYPVYWKDVVGPLYRKTAEYQKTLRK